MYVLCRHAVDYHTTDTYPSVPADPVLAVKLCRPSLIFLHNPKSDMSAFNVLDFLVHFVMRTFPGLMSRCTEIRDKVKSDTVTNKKLVIILIGC